jgi:HPr kinase/phosphorylase
LTKQRRKEAIISGGLLRVNGLGLLIVGDSGIGKSESALELIARGHRFVSDDVVQVQKTAAGRIIGQAPALSRYFMEIRGLGIINIHQIFGPKSIAHRAPIDLVIRLKKWHRKREYDRLGLRFPEDCSVLGERIPQLIIPVAPGRNIATLIEVACKVHLLRRNGYRAPFEIVDRLNRTISRAQGAKSR